MYKMLLDLVPDQIYNNELMTWHYSDECKTQK